MSVLKVFALPFIHIYSILYFKIIPGVQVAKHNNDNKNGIIV